MMENLGRGGRGAAGPRFGRGGQYRRARSSLPEGRMDGTPDVVVVGAAARDIVHDDPRGWRLGGGVSYAALTLARLGLRTGALVGADPEAARSRELDFLRA